MGKYRTRLVARGFRYSSSHSHSLLEASLLPAVTDPVVMAGIVQNPIPSETLDTLKCEMYRRIGPDADPEEVTTALRALNGRVATYHFWIHTK